MKIKHLIITFLVFAGNPWTASLHAEKMKVIAAYPWIASITQNIAGDLAEVQFLANGKWDPHFIVPRPSFIAKLRDARLLIMNGGELEIGWMPPLLSQANNDRLSGKGILTLAHYVQLRDIPRVLSRTEGDIHPEGDPHFLLNPDNILPVAKAISERLSELDPVNAARYRENLEIFNRKWLDRIKQWNLQMAILKGKPVIQYHKLFNYLFYHFGLVEQGTVERLPGIPPTPQHLEELEKIIKSKNIRIILQDVYNKDEASKLLAKKMNIKIIYLPHDVGAVTEARDIFTLFDEIVRRLTHD